MAGSCGCRRAGSGGGSGGGDSSVAPAPADPKAPVSGTLQVFAYEDSVRPEMIDPVTEANPDLKIETATFDSDEEAAAKLAGGFQAGAFDGFAPEKIARYGEKKVHALMNDAGIVRNRSKIEGAVNSAKGYLKIMEEGPGFSKFLWDFVDGKPKVNQFKTTASVPASTPISIKISKELGARGFKFVGPTIVYAFMQATGMVNDHMVTCHRHAPLAKLAGR